jgi:hypothetical protein
LIRQFFLIPSKINEFVDRKEAFRLLPESVLPEFDHYLAVYTIPTLQ